MNLLIFVLAFLLMFASLSYNAFDRYAADALLRARWEYFMRVRSLCAFRKPVGEKYKELNRKANQATKDQLSSEEETPTPPPPSSSENKDKDEDETKDSTSGISMYYLIAADFVQARPEQTELMMGVLERLIDFLFGDQIFYKNIIDVRPEALQEMVAQVREVNQKRPHPIMKIGNISKLALPDTQLYFLWYQLLRENPVSLSVLEVLLQKPAAEINLETTCAEVSLFDYISASKKSLLRVYLIPHGLLYAIFQDREIVKQVVEMRKTLHKEYSKEAEAELTARFKNFCLQFSNINELQPILDFAVTSTNPSNYASF